MSRKLTETRPEKYLLVARALVETPTITAAAQKVGLTRETLHRYLQDPAFLVILDAMRAQVHAAAVSAAAAAAEAAVLTVIRLMGDPMAPASVRLSAARLVMDLAGKRVLESHQNGGNADTNRASEALYMLRRIEDRQ